MRYFTPTDGRSAGSPLSIAFVATAPPRQCGIATFTADLARAIRETDPRVPIAWAAIDEAASSHRYGPDVAWRIRQHNPESYAEAARLLNDADVDVVAVQHEFGLYGIWREPFEDHLAPFLEELRKPLVTTLHTVLPAPSPSIRAAVQRIGRRSEAVVVMAETARTILVEGYGLAPHNVHVIPHGVPPIEPRGRTAMKTRFGLQDRTLISTFGLVDPRKGLEFMIGAMSAIAVRHPDVLYLILGRTHPELVRQHGEAYRAELYALVRGHNLDAHVCFIDEYLSQQAVIDYLLASDIYVTPYLDPNQITSGTLAYALGAGKAIVSTPYLHAVESLAERRGILVDFRSEAALAEAALRILDDPTLKHELEQNAYRYGRETAWPAVAARMLHLYRSVIGVPASAAAPVAPAAAYAGWNSAERTGEEEIDEGNLDEPIVIGAGEPLATLRAGRAQ